jgi:hypothetical protein
MDLVTQNPRRNLLFLYSHPDKVLSALQSRLQNRVLGSSSFAEAAVLEFAAGQPVLMFPRGTGNGRHQDTRLDLSVYNQRDFALLEIGPPALDEVIPYFRQVRTEEVVVEGEKFYLVLADGFRFSAYRDTVLREVSQRYYQRPPQLPGAACPYLAKYSLF